MSEDGGIHTEHSHFIRNAVIDVSLSTGTNSQFSAAQLINISTQNGLNKEALNSSRDMCPYCLNLWSSGQYKIKAIPKIRRKGKYKVTALELTCLNCTKKVKINNSKIRRSQIQNKLSKNQKKNNLSEEKLGKKRKHVNDTKNIKMVKPYSEERLFVKTKKNKKSLETPSDAPTLSRQVSSSSQNSSHSISKGKSVPKNAFLEQRNPSQQANIAQKNKEKKRMKLQKVLSKSSQSMAKPKSVLENFLNSVQSI